MQHGDVYGAIHCCELTSTNNESVRMYEFVYSVFHSQFDDDNNAMTKKQYKVVGMHCASCAAVIEADLEDAGVNASCSYAKQTLDVEFDDTKVKEEKIHSIIQESGYSLSS